MNKKKFIFFLYCFFILLVVVIKLQDGIDAIRGTMDSIAMSRELGCWNINFISFDTISMNLTDLNYMVPIANIILFIPLGVLLPWTFDRITRFLQVFGWAVGFIFVCEFLQFIFKLGYFDIDDVMFNIIGAYIGYLIHRFLINKKRSYDKSN